MSNQFSIDSFEAMLSKCLFIAQTFILVLKYIWFPDPFQTTCNHWTAMVMMLLPGKSLQWNYFVIMSLTFYQLVQKIRMVFCIRINCHLHFARSTNWTFKGQFRQSLMDNIYSTTEYWFLTTTLEFGHFSASDPKLLIFYRKKESNAQISNGVRLILFDQPSVI